MEKADSGMDIKTPPLPNRAERAHDIARKVFQRAEELNLEPVPHVYELWFRYFQGDPEIVRAIDNHPEKMDEAVCHRFYQRYLSEAAKNDALKAISDRVQQAVAELGGMLKSAKSVTSEYGDALGEVSRKMEDAETIEDLSRVVSSIVEDTKMMVQKNHDLEFQLTNSSTQVAELRKNLDNVKKEAMTDGLTGLANRKAFDKQIRDWVEEASVSGVTLCLMMLDIDRFKQFNDTYGHQTGDQVLRLVARTLTDGVKGRDMAARFGGEEFAIILPDTPLAGALRVAETLRKSVEGKEVINKTSNENLGQITLSAGVAQYVRGESVTDFIGRSDAALYDAKKGGRNQVRAATEQAQ
ncbi:MAG: GGDEF domain-containing protein [Pseudomonadota bacterium]